MSAWICRLLRLFILLNIVCLSACVLPVYTPALIKEGGINREDLIWGYFVQGFTNAEIVGFLLLQHGIICSVRTVKRILRRLRLKRSGRNNESPIEHIVFAIVEELENSCGSFKGYRQLTRRLRLKYNLQVRRDTAMKSLRIIDPEGVECRKRRRLKRRWYGTTGPNFLWHVDGWDKLAPFGVPRRLRSDRGTENTIMGNLQRFFRWHNPDDFAVSASFLAGKSCGNQRIEAWWSKFREGGGAWWMNLFKDLRDTGFYRDDCLIKECLKFCFLPVIRRELRLVVELWNTHNIQRQTRCEVEGGKPHVMFFTPEMTMGFKIFQFSASYAML